MLRTWTRRYAFSAVVSLVLVVTVAPHRAHGQFWKRAVQAGGCLVAGVAGARIGEELAEYEAKRFHLSAAAREDLEKRYKIGFGLALCGGGAAVAGTAYEKLSEKGREAREREVLAALDDAEPHSYVDPDDPTLAGTVIAQPVMLEGDQECRVVEDHLGGDAALIKYCRDPGGAWELKAV